MRYFFALAALVLSLAFAPLVAQAGPPTTAAATLALKTEGLAQLCATRLHLDNTQAAMLRYYLQDQLRTLRLEVEGGTLPAPALPAIGQQRLNAMATNLLTPQQLVDYHKLMASAEAAPLLRGLALLAN